MISIICMNMNMLCSNKENYAAPNMIIFRKRRRKISMFQDVNWVKYFSVSTDKYLKMMANKYVVSVWKPIIINLTRFASKLQKFSLSSNAHIESQPWTLFDPFQYFFFETRWLNSMREIEWVDFRASKSKVTYFLWR